MPMPPLKMVVRQDRTAYDRKVRVGAQKIMRKPVHAVKELFKLDTVLFECVGKGVGTVKVEKGVL